jgi:hypothetical protein
METPHPESPPAGDATLERLDDQIEWYDRHSARQRRFFYFLKVVTIVAAASIPLLAVISPNSGWDKIVPSLLGGLIVVIEGIQQLFQLHDSWILYRSTCESLRSEKYLYLGNAGPYAAAQNPHALLAERVESLVSQEMASWISSQQSSQQVGKSRQPAATVQEV